MKYRKLVITTALAASLAGAAFVVVPQAAAQGPDGQNPPVSMAAFEVCSTTDYTEVAAKALGVTATELRVALAGGKSLEALAQDKKVEYKTVTDAIQAAETADIDQAVKDGLLTQAQADALKSAQTNQPQNAPDAQSNNGAQNAPGKDGAQGAPGTGDAQGMPLDGAQGPRGMGRVDGVSARNEVKSVAVAAGALGMSCADLAKALESGKSISTVATDKGVQIQTVTDALVKAYQDALNKDVEEGLVSKVQADTEKAKFLDQALSEIARSGLFQGRGGKNAQGMPARNGAPADNGGQPPANVTPMPTPGS
jgi:transposase